MPSGPIQGPGERRIYRASSRTRLAIQSDWTTAVNFRRRCSSRVGICNFEPSKTTMNAAHASFIPQIRSRRDFHVTPVTNPKTVNLVIAGPLVEGTLIVARIVRVPLSVQTGSSVPRWTAALKSSVGQPMVIATNGGRTCPWENFVSATRYVKREVAW